MMTTTIYRHRIEATYPDGPRLLGCRLQAPPKGHYKPFETCDPREADRIVEDMQRLNSKRQFRRVTYKTEFGITGAGYPIRFDHE